MWGARIPPSGISVVSSGRVGATPVVRSDAEEYAQCGAGAQAGGRTARIGNAELEARVQPDPGGIESQRERDAGCAARVGGHADAEHRWSEVERAGAERRGCGSERQQQDAWRPRSRRGQRYREVIAAEPRRIGASDVRSPRCRNPASTSPPSTACSMSSPCPAIESSSSFRAATTWSPGASTIDNPVTKWKHATSLPNLVGPQRLLVGATRARPPPSRADLSPVQRKTRTRRPRRRRPHRPRSIVVQPTAISGAQVARRGASLSARAPPRRYLVA